MANHSDDKAPSSALVSVRDQPPAVLPAVVLTDFVPFPGPVVPVLLDEGPRRDAILQAKSEGGFFVLVNRVSQDTEELSDLDLTELKELTQQVSLAVDTEQDTGDLSDDITVVPIDDDEEENEAQALPESLSEIHRVGILARLVRVLRLPDGRVSALVHLMRRAQPLELVQKRPYPALRLMYPVEVVENRDEFEAIFRQVRLTLKQFFDAHPMATDEMKSTALGIESPATLADFVAQHLSRGHAERLAFLTELDVSKRLRQALEVCIRELDLLTVGNRISEEIRQKVEQHQRDFLLREQLKAIRVELGEEKDPAVLAVEELQAKLDKAGLSEIARKRADEELKRLQMVPPESPEHNVVRSYLEWIGSLPWSALTADSRDIVRAREILDADHYGLQEVKDRIIEFLAVHQLNPAKTGSILCFAGPPGVGKTSLGQSIAKALGRKFYRFSVGGMRDEAEIKGHRRTYIGAMPGRLLQGLRQVESRNPVFMLDELDKMGSDWRGDPSSALLEVLDPAQNHAFTDHYLDLPFDLSRVMFIATANVESEIPPALYDRLEIIDLPGYIPEEKLEIANRHLFPRQRKEHGMTKTQLSMDRAATKRVIREYTHEAGVRELERQLGRVCRKRATEIVMGKKGNMRVGIDKVETYLGAPKIHDDRLIQNLAPGLAIGLAWTAAGGDILYIEMVAMEGKGTMKVTGHLGEVMSESAQLAVSYVRSRVDALGIDPKKFVDCDFHLHFPAGAVRKDGPSAGVTITTALISVLTGKKIVPRLAMTGEITLRGEVLPVGGIREKVVAARRAGIRTVVLPERNRADVEEIPAEVREHITFVYASHYDDVAAVAFHQGKKPRVAKKKVRKTSKKKVRK